MPSLPNPDPKQITPSACPFCRRAVVVAHLHGRRVLVERAPYEWVGRQRIQFGDIALTRDFWGDTLEPRYTADRVSNATPWRLHAGTLCAGALTRAFSADAAFDRKRPGKVEREIFRQLRDRATDGKRRRR